MKEEEQKIEQLRQEFVLWRKQWLKDWRIDNLPGGERPDNTYLMWNWFVRRIAQTEEKTNQMWRARLEALKRPVTLERPVLRQYESRGSAPFHCSLCGESEMNLMDNKTEDERYYCRCSYWSDPHNAYLDKSGGIWLGWVDENKARKIAEEYPCEDNAYNQALIDALLSESTKENTWQK